MAVRTLFSIFGASSGVFLHVWCPKKGCAWLWVKVQLILFNHSSDAIVIPYSQRNDSLKTSCYVLSLGKVSFCKSDGQTSFCSVKKHNENADGFQSFLQPAGQNSFATSYQRLYGTDSGWPPLAAPHLAIGPWVFILIVLLSTTHTYPN